MLWENLKKYDLDTANRATQSNEGIPVAPDKALFFTTKIYKKFSYFSM